MSMDEEENSDLQSALILSISKNFSYLQYSSAVQFKAAFINIFQLMLFQMNMCNVKTVARSEKQKSVEIKPELKEEECTSAVGEKCNTDNIVASYLIDVKVDLSKTILVFVNLLWSSSAPLWTKMDSCSFK